jgi:hypothetical protein
MNGCSNNLLRLFLSARCLKKVSPLDAVCRKCRWKFDNWIRKTKEDFDDFIGPDGIMKIMVNIGTVNSDERVMVSI